MNRWLLTAILLSCALDQQACAAEAVVQNADFTEGQQDPAAWQLTTGQGKWVERQILEVTGDGTDTACWRSDCRFVPSALYRFEARGRGTPTSGSAILGPVFANRDYQTPSADWMWVGHVFRVPEDVTDSHIRLGHWQARGTIQYDAVRLQRVVPVHTQFGPLVLGDGEQIQEGRYTFTGIFSHEGSNYHRPLQSATASFNSDRWVFAPGQQITYRFELPGSTFQAGHLTCSVNYYTSGGCTAQVSRDGQHWQDVATQSAAGSVDASLPDELLPAPVIFLRLKSSSDNTSLQVNRVELSAAVSDPPDDAVGQTLFAAMDDWQSDVEPRQLLLLSSDGSSDGSSAKSLRVSLQNNTDKALDALLTTQVVAPGGEQLPVLAETAHFVAGATVTLERPLTAQRPGRHQLQMKLASHQQPAQTSKLMLDYNVPDYDRTDYGARLSDVAVPGLAVWWCPATHKVAPQRAVPQRTAAVAELAAAKNDYEAVQIVLRPDRDLTGVTARASELRGVNGTRLPADCVSIQRVAYHFVRHPTDGTGTIDFWPDALPPLAAPLDLRAGRNQPLWILVHVPTDAVAGDYRGWIELEGTGFTARVPLQLQVWDFALPETNHLETAFGLSLGEIVRYHGLQTEQQKRQVWDMYLNCLSQHRISPYDAVPLDPIRVKFRSDLQPPQAEMDFSRFDAALSRAVQQYHFTGYRLPVEGMGGGTFHSRSEPSINGFTADTAEYQAMFGSYAGQLEKYFRDRGWLHLPYIYWFDEPDPKDYQFVADGFARLKQHAPGLQRMLTEEPGDNALAELVDIWCPITPSFDPVQAERRRAQGQRFWWYVCTGPKAPYCTLFIDHPATELRVWLWQTWQHDIRGILVWASNYWTSDEAFPDSAQNPYDDPMGYVTGYSTPRGTKNFWGNGDGRFVYPPEAAAVPGHSGPDPVLAPPVSSLRLEMLREGIEDYEMLFLLRQRLQARRSQLSTDQVAEYEKLLQVPDSITRNMTTFTTDPTPIYARRAEIAAAIERLK